MLGSESEPVKGRIGPDVIVRLARLQSSLSTETNTLFPSIERLRIDKARSSMDYLHLFVCPTLTEIEITGVSKDHLDAFYSFFTTVAEEVPDLSSLILGPGLIPGEVLGMCHTFCHLQHLKFVNINTSFGIDFLENIGRLELLQSLAVDMGDLDGGLYVSRASELKRVRVERGKKKKSGHRKERVEAAAVLQRKKGEEIRIKELGEQLHQVQELEASGPSSCFAGELEKECAGKLQLHLIFQKLMYM